MARVFEGLACLAIETEDFERALTLAGVAAGLRDALGSAPRADEEITLQQKLQAAWKSLDPSQRKKICGLCGSEMPLEDAIRYALESPGDPAPAGSYAKVEGSTRRRTAATRSTRKLLRLPCSRIIASSGA